MVDIQSAAAEIRRGKEKKKKLQDKNTMSASATQGGHNEKLLLFFTDVPVTVRSYNGSVG